MTLEPDAQTVETIAYQPKTWSSYANGKRYQRDFVQHLYKEYKFKSTTWFSFFETFIYSHIPEENVRLDAIVKTIDHSDKDEIKVVLSHGEIISAARVIVTASAGVLQNDMISFSPALPKEWKEELHKIQFGPGFKAWFEFDERFYPDVQIMGKLWNGIHSTNTVMYFDAVLGKDVSRNILGSLQVGKVAKERSQMKDEDIKKVLIEELDKLYDGKASKFLQTFAIRNWTKEPFVRGAYSVSSGHNVQLLQRGTGRIVFAGEHIGEPQGVVQGAALSGRQAVELLLS